MKINQITNWICFSTAFVGVLLKIMHWPGANILITITLIALLVSCVLSFGSNKQAGMGNTINYFLTLALLILIMGAGFNFYHWPGSFTFRVMSYIIFVTLPIVMFVSNRENKVSNNYWITFLIYVMLVIPMMTSKIDGLHEKINSMQNTEANP